MKTSDNMSIQCLFLSSIRQTVFYLYIFSKNMILQIENNNIFSFISYFNNWIAFYYVIYTLCYNLTQKMFFESTTNDNAFKMLYCSFKY